VQMNSSPPHRTTGSWDAASSAARGVSPASPSPPHRHLASVAQSAFSPQTPVSSGRTGIARRPLSALEPSICRHIVPIGVPSGSACHAEGRGFESIGALTGRVRSVWAVTSDRAGWFPGWRRADSLTFCRPVGVTDRMSCRPSPPEDHRRDLIGAWR
jgi:hypothetical protein